MRNKVMHIKAGDIIYAPNLEGGMTLLCAFVEPNGNHTFRSFYDSEFVLTKDELQNVRHLARGAFPIRDEQQEWQLLSILSAVEDALQALQPLLDTLSGLSATADSEKLLANYGHYARQPLLVSGEPFTVGDLRQAARAVVELKHTYEWVKQESTEEA